MFIKILVTIVVALITFCIVYIASERNFGVGLLGVVCAICMCLVGFSPTGYDRRYAAETHSYNTPYQATIPCDHIKCYDDLLKCDARSASVYTTNFEFMFLKEDSIVFVNYCPKCYNATAARNYYYKHKNSSDDFAN